MWPRAGRRGPGRRPRPEQRRLGTKPGRALGLPSGAGGPLLLAHSRSAPGDAAAWTVGSGSLKWSIGEQRQLSTWPVGSLELGLCGPRREQTRTAGRAGGWANRAGRGRARVGVGGAMRPGAGREAGRAGGRDRKCHAEPEQGLLALGAVVPSVVRLFGRMAQICFP